MGKFDLTGVIKEVQDSLKKDNRRKKQFGLGDNLGYISQDDSDYVVMPEWWKATYGVPGLQFGKIVEIAGNSDSGKTSLCIEAMKRAIAQGYGVIYVETELKTTTEDLVNAGIDPTQVMLVQTAITEEAFDGSFRLWDQFFDKFPDEKLLFVYDSYGNTVSLRDSEIDMTREHSKVGGAAKTNRLGINTMIAKMQRDTVAVLFVNYSYSNIGTVGKTNAGGNALQFFSTIIIQSAKGSKIRAVRNKKDVILGREVIWTTDKNHYAKALLDAEGDPVLLPPKVQLAITSEGFKVKKAKGD